MKLAMNFFDPEIEVENLCDFVTTTYWAHTHRAHAPPSAEEVFPELCRFAGNCGVVDPFEDTRGSPGYAEAQVQKLCICVRYAFRVAPHLVPSLLQTDPDSAHKPAGPEPAEMIPANLATRAILELAQMPQGEEAQPLAAREDRPLGSVFEDEGKPKISPYRVEQALTRIETIRIIGEALFVYSDGYYAHISPECLRRLIMRDCRKAVEAAGTPRLIEEVYKFLLCDPELFRQEEDADENLIAFDNGVLDIRSGSFYQHSPAYNVFYRLGTWWGSRSPHPCFDRFVDDITGGDKLLAQRILECIGYCLSGDTHGKLFFVLQGLGSSGKTVLAKFIQSCINADATTAIDITKLGDRFVAANLVGKQLCLSMDIPSTPLNAATTATFKSVTGGDPITADVKYSPHVTFFNRAKFILGTNHALRTQEDDPAFFDRVVAIPFRYGIPRERRNPHLLEDLATERASIVYDALQAYRGLCSRSYQFSGTYEINEMFTGNGAATVQSVEALIQDFVKKHCVPAPGEVIFVDDLLSCFREHYPAAGVNEYRFGSSVLAACHALGIHGVSRGAKKRKDGHPNAQANLLGLKLKEDFKNGK